MRAVFAGLIFAFCCSAASLSAGAAKRTVTPDFTRHAPVYLAGFGNNRVATGVHDDLYARCIAFRAGLGRPLVICGVDSIGLFFDDVKAIRGMVEGADVIVTATHDHEAPDTMGLWGPDRTRSGINAGYLDYVVERTAEAAAAAVAALEPASVRLASATSPELDKLIHDTRPPVRHDSGIIALAAVSTSGKPIGTLVNWANHPEALGSKNTLITADYLAAFHSVMENTLGGVSVFCNGAVGGMQSPLGAKLTDWTGAAIEPETFRFADVVGLRAAEIAANAIARAPRAGIEAITFQEKVIAIPMTNPGFELAMKAGIFRGRKQPNRDGTSNTPVGYVRFEGAAGPVLEIALVPGELYPELSVGGIERYAGADHPDAPLEPAIKQQMRARFRMLFGLANDEIGYIIPKAEWDDKAPWLQNAGKRWYGEVNSIGPEAAPMITAAFAELVRTAA
ncbi:MAG TPA: hypothetical protein VFL57_06770, partial [Bryobacteraceae bacterium]|nr:hypothetical protein [Bryobacteraceae bacterium]